MAKKKKAKKKKSTRKKKPSAAQKKAQKRFKRMVTEAKKIKKGHPKMQFKTAMKKAAKKIK